MLEFRSPEIFLPAPRRRGFLDICRRNDETAVCPSQEGMNRGSMTG